MNAGPSLYFLTVVERALEAGGQLMLLDGAPRDLAERVPSSRQIQLDRTLFGYRVPILPGFLASSNLAGASERERLAEVLARQVGLVTRLGSWTDMGIALRYLVRPEQGRIEVAVLGRALAPLGQGGDLAARLAADLAASLAVLELTPEPVSTESELTELLEPFAEPNVVEVRQREDEIRLPGIARAYIVYPFDSSTGTWLGLCTALMQQSAPCMVSVYLQPTRLHERERATFETIVTLANRLTDFQYQGLAGITRFAMPEAAFVARLHTEYPRRLAAPFLVSVQVASPDPASARAVAQALGAEISANAAPASPDLDPNRLPGGFELAEPRDPNERQLARRTLHRLDFQRWGADRVSPGKERLRHLVDARSASAVFRFPIALRGGIPGIRVRQPLAAYETGSRPAAVGAGQIHIGSFAERGGAAGVPVAAFARHVLVAGTNGSGKTTSCFQLLGQLWERGIPFLVIEPAKQEYRALLDSPLGPSLRIFTLGDESVAPFRLNPLEILPGVRVESHLAQLRACVEASLPTFGPLPGLIEESLHQVYQDHGWDLTDRAKTNERRLMPTLGELYAAIIQASERRGYSEKTLQDIRAAAAGRIGSLLRGSKGRLLNTRRSLPLAELMAGPTVLELESLNDDERALVMLFLLTFLREHCRVNRSSSGLQHVTLIEEAHRVMAATAHVGNREVSADTRAEATAMFSAALSEVRAYGEGLIIAEQIPSRLAEDALKNTNTKLIHRLLGEDDCQAVGATMRLLPQQAEQLPALRSGVAALYTDGYERPTFVQVDNPRAAWSLPERVPDERIEQHQATFEAAHRTALLPFQGCQHCDRQCRYRDQVTPIVYETGTARQFRRAVGSFDQAIRRGEAGAGWRELVKSCQEALRPYGLDGDEHAAFCYFSHLWETKLPPDVGDQFRRTAQEARDGHA